MKVLEISKLGSNKIIKYEKYFSMVKFFNMLFFAFILIIDESYLLGVYYPHCKEDEQVCSCILTPRSGGDVNRSVYVTRYINNMYEDYLCLSVKGGDVYGASGGF